MTLHSTLHAPFYTLSTDPWWCWTPGIPLSRPFYRLGVRVGLAGFRSNLPVFPSHDLAIRASLSGAPLPMPLSALHRPLSTAEVMDLRVAAKSHVHDPAAPVFAFAIYYNASSDMYDVRLSHSGAVLTSHGDIAVIGALLRGERFEPGFIRKVLSAEYVAEELTLDADARERSRRERAATSAHTRAQAREAEEKARAARRGSPATSEAPSDLSIDDLFDDTL